MFRAGAQLCFAEGEEFQWDLEWGLEHPILLALVGCSRTAYEGKGRLWVETMGDTPR